MVVVTRQNSQMLLGNASYPFLGMVKENEQLKLIAYKESESQGVCIPNVKASDLGDSSFLEDYHVKYAYVGGAMASAISSAELVIALGKAGFIGSFGAGACPFEVVKQSIRRIKAALPEGNYLVNMLATREKEKEMQLAEFLIEEDIPAVEASGYIQVSEALAYYRIKGISRKKDGSIHIPHKVMVKLSREEVLEKFMMPFPMNVIKGLEEKGKITKTEALLATEITIVDDITVEADSGGHTDGRPLIALLPTMNHLKEQLQKKYGYKKKIRLGAAGGIGNDSSALGAFELGADYIVTGSINQACREAGTSPYVKKLLSELAMADVVMAPCAERFEEGAKAQVVKKGTMFPQNSQKLYDCYKAYDSFEEVPKKLQEYIEKHIFRNSFEEVWELTKVYFKGKNEKMITLGESWPKCKMALTFKWYVGGSSNWAVAGLKEHLYDLQIWCSQSMGAFNVWVKDSYLEPYENRQVSEIAQHIMKSAAYLATCHMAQRAGAQVEEFLPYQIRELEKTNEV